MKRKWAAVASIATNKLRATRLPLMGDRASMARAGSLEPSFGGDPP